MSLWIHGFDKSDPNAPARGKVKVETANSSLYKGTRYERANRVFVRGKSGTPAQIAKYVADSLNKIASEIPPHFTHTTGRDASRPRSRPSPRHPITPSPLRRRRR